MVKMIYTPADQALAERIQAGIQEPSNAVIVLMSPLAAADVQVRSELEAALDNNRHIVPVMVQTVPLPHLIEHLEPVDFTQGYDSGALQAQLAEIPGEMHLKVHTPSVQAANRRLAVVVALGALIMFVAALYGVGVLGIQAPQEEYDAVETEVIETRNAFIDEALPRSTEDALNFEVTVQSAAPTLRPWLSATATAIAGQ